MDFPDVEVVVVAPEDEWITPTEASTITRVSPKTLANWRSMGIGPDYSKLGTGRGSRVRYRRGEVQRWMRSKAIA